MKNYLIGLNNSNEFILNYKIRNNKIIVNYIIENKKKNYTIPYSIENEKKLLEKMKQQVLNSNGFEKLQKDYIIESSILLNLGGAGVAFMGPLSLVSHFIGNPKGLLDFMVICSISLCIIGLYESIVAPKKLSDIEKHKLFIENEDFINEGLKNNKKLNLQLNLNDIDKISYNDLKYIIENITRVDISKKENNRIKVLIKQ